jgi:hypothetical protein
MLFLITAVIGAMSYLSAGVAPLAAAAAFAEAPAVIYAPAEPFALAPEDLTATVLALAEASTY